ncbi:MAG: hypothetical protein Q4B72_11710 [Lachnospiraceae bacterium]|nr:hypothetical protein [Lachnospiraceae bacterium]
MKKDGQNVGIENTLSTSEILEVYRIRTTLAIGAEVVKAPSIICSGSFIDAHSAWNGGKLVTMHEEKASKKYYCDPVLFKPFFDVHCEIPS